VKGKIGEISEIGSQSFFVATQGGRIEVLKAKHEDGKKVGRRIRGARTAFVPGALLGG